MRKFRSGLALLLLLPVLAAGPAAAAGGRYTVPEEGSASVGPKSAPVTIVEFVDYQ